MAGAELVLGERVQNVSWLVAAAVFTGLAWTGVRRNRPVEPRPWQWMCVALTLLTLETACVVAGYVHPLPTIATGLDEVFSFAGIISAVVCIRLFAKARSSQRDPAAFLDALVVTAGFGLVAWTTITMPYFRSPGVTLNQQLQTGALIALYLVVLGTFAHVMMASGIRNRSFNLMTTGMFAILGSILLILCELSGVVVPHGLSIENALMIFAFSTAAAGALHPSMAEVTRASRSQLERQSWWRYVVLALALVTPPTVLVVEVARTHRLTDIYWLAPCWAITTTLTMIRFGGMIATQQRLARRERILSRCATALVSNASRDAIYNATLTALIELSRENARSVAASVIMRTGKKWETVATAGYTGSRRSEPQPRTSIADSISRLAAPAPPSFSDDELDAALRSTPPFVQMSGDQNLTVNKTTMIPLVSQSQLRGALIVSTSRWIQEPVIETLISLAADASLALEALALSDNLLNQRTDQRFRTLIEHSHDLIIVIDDNDETAFASPTAERILRHGDKLRSLLDVVYEDDRAGLENALIRLRDGEHRDDVECRMTNAVGELRWFELILTDLRSDEQIDGIIVNGREVTERKSLEQDLRHRVLHDDLTGIANRVLLRERVEHALTIRQIGKSQVTAMFIDLDDFKDVNDGLGHEAGDVLLRTIAQRLNSFVRDEDTAARLGGDEFALCFRSIASEADAVDISQRLLSSLKQPMTINGHEVSVGASIGIAFGSDEETADTLLRNADVAMYHAKWDGKGSARIFRPSMFEHAIERLELKGDLPHTIERNELMLHFQPIVRFPGMAIDGFEALVRWNHPKRGRIDPGRFIALAEQTGFIDELGEWALETAVHQLAQWQRIAPNVAVRMSVNLSPYQLQDTHLARTVEHLLNKYAVDPAALTMELTESSAIDEAGKRDRLADLGALGVGIAADDFGSGFASYASLTQLPFTTVKIDRSLLMQLFEDGGRGEAQVLSIITMAHDLGLVVVAEGIETIDQYRLLGELGCDLAQGFLVGQPAPAEYWHDIIVGSENRNTQDGNGLSFEGAAGEILAAE